MIKFRPHHFMCTLAFQGYGYSDDFIKNYKEIVGKIFDNPDIKIEIVGNLDSICGACPNKINIDKCNKQAKVLELDRKHMEVLEMQVGEILTWSEAAKKIKEKMSIEKFEYACKGCSWQQHGMCKSALLNHLAS